VFAQQEQTSVPLEKLPSGHYALTVKLSEKQSARLLIDTGAAQCILSKDIVKKLSLPIEPVPKEYSIPKSVGVIGHIVLPECKIGDFPIENVRFFIVNEIPFQLESKKPIDGILGVNSFQKYALLFQWSRKRVTFYSPGNLSTERLLAANMNPAECLPLKQVAESTLLSTPARFDTKEEDFLIDTGVDTTTVYKAELLNHLNAIIAGTPKQYWMQHGSILMQPIKVKSFQLGEIVYLKVKVHYPRSPDAAMQSLLKDAPSLLGLNILQKSDLLIDFPAKKMYIKRPAKL